MAGAPAGDNPVSGYAVWDADLLLIAASAPDEQAFGYLCVSLSEPARLADAAARRRWTAALSRAVMAGGVRFDDGRQTASWLR